MKSKTAFFCYIFITILIFSGLCFAAEKNVCDLNVNASDGDEGSNVIYLASSELELDWAEKVYYAPKVAEDGSYGNFHCTMTVKNTGSSDADLYVKIDFLWPPDTTTPFVIPTNLTGYYKWCYFDTSGTIPYLALSNGKQKLATLAGDESITLFDFLGSNTFQFQGPILISAMMVDPASATEEMLGVDSEMIFFNTDFTKWIRAHAPTTP